MAKVFNVRNSGNSAVILGLRNVNSYNVFPTNVVALPTPFASLSNNIWQNYDWLNAVQTSAATDAIFLPTPVGPNSFGELPAAYVGAEYRVYAVSAMKVLPPVDAVSTINGGTNVQGISLAAGTYGIFTATKTVGVGLVWVCQAVSAAGAVTSPASA